MQEEQIRLLLVCRDEMHRLNRDSQSIGLS